MRAGYSHDFRFTPAQKKSFADPITGQVEEVKALDITIHLLIPKAAS